MSDVLDQDVLVCTPWNETPGNDPNRVCRDISVRIPQSGYDTNPRTGLAAARGGEVKASPLPTLQEPVRAYLGRVLGTNPGDANSGPKIEHVSRENLLNLGNRGIRGLFFGAVHRCFQEHYPLALSPEILMYLVLHEVSIAVKLNPERYRHLFTFSEEKQTIVVRHDGLVLGALSPWHEVIGTFGRGLEERVPSEIMAQALPNLSTHSVESRAASLVAFMDAASPFYDYRCMTMCGIPKVRLLGTPQDYEKVLQSCSALATLFQEDLGRYFEHLIPVLTTIREQANPSTTVDQNFWLSLYNHMSSSGTDASSGWIMTFLNYIQDREGNPVPKREALYDWKKAGRWEGVDRSSLPTHLNQVPFIWEYYGRELPMEFVGGVLGLDDLDGYATPRLGYGVLHAKK